MEIFLCYRQLFVEGDVFMGEWEIFVVEVFLCYSPFFIKGNFIIGRIECTDHSFVIVLVLILCVRQVLTFLYLLYF